MPGSPRRLVAYSVQLVLIVAGLRLFSLNSSAQCPGVALKPQAVKFLSDGGPGSFTVTGPTCPSCRETRPTCPSWTATPDCSWVHVTHFTGTGNGAVDYLVDANPDLASRVCKIIVATNLEYIYQSPNAFEYDEHGKLVPATLQHIYRWAFRHQNILEKESDKVLSKGMSGSLRQNLRFRLEMTEADFAVFRSAALIYGQKEKEIKARTAAVGKADLTEHPNNPALSWKARTAVAALFAEQDEALSIELATMKAALSPASAAALDRQVIYEYAKGFLPDQQKTLAPASPAAKPQPGPSQQGGSGPSQAPAAGKAPQNWHVTEGRVKIKLSTTEMTAAQANKIPLDLHGFDVGRVVVEWQLPEREGQYAPESEEAPLQRESDGNAYVNFVPVRLGKLKLRIMVDFVDGGIDHDRLEVNVNRLPDQPPARLILSLGTDFTRRAGTLALDFSPLYHRLIVAPVAFYKGVDSPIPLIPAPSQIQNQLSYTIIPRKNQASPIVFDPETGEVRSERLGQALLKVTLDNHSAYACMDVMRDTSEFIQRSNCSDFLPPDLTEPIDKPFYTERRAAPPAH